MKTDVIKNVSCIISFFFFLLFYFSFSSKEQSEFYAGTENTIENIVSRYQWHEKVNILNFSYCIQLFPFFYVCKNVCKCTCMHTLQSCICYRQCPYIVFSCSKVSLDLFWTALCIEINIRILTHDVLENLKFKSWLWNFIVWELNFDF